MSMMPRIAIPFMVCCAVLTAVSAHEEYYLEELCGENMVVNLNETSKFIIQLSKNEDDLTSTGRHGSCHGLLHFRWSGYQELWVTVRVRNASFVKDPAADQQQQQQYGGCNAVHALQLVSHDGIRSLIGPSEFSMRFVSDVRFKYYRLGVTGENSTFWMTVMIEPFNIPTRAEYFNRRNYHNVSLEEYCGRNVFENVTDGTIRWFLNTAAPSFDEPPRNQCFTLFTFHNTKMLSSEKDASMGLSVPYFVNIEMGESQLRKLTIPQHGCLMDQQVVLRGCGWIHTLEPRRRSSLLMRHSGHASLGYFRRKPFDEQFAELNISIRINEGDEYVMDVEYNEQEASELQVTIISRASVPERKLIEDSIWTLVDIVSQALLLNTIH
ncbi:uncharacterized protein LOC111251077 isoform X2 [Varroa destructor]|uniref:Uncharacterized protein n=1 Tax=Varroa destructor TaxID=109461 RepID=A0A7M7KG61_VARDE|nr:uncharacterized protein LOC111251077 isoform X2 [Varroa destructor]